MSNTYFDLSTGSFLETWTNTGRITTADDWSQVASIVGYRGDSITSATGVDPQTLTADSNAINVINVLANQTNPTTLNTGGVAEFELADPTIALNGSGTADAPFIQLYLNAAGRQDVTLSFNVRDLDASIDNAIQQIAVQYRSGPSGAWTNLPAGYVADATTGPSLASLVTPVSVTLPAGANDQGQLEVRIMTTNAVGNDEWVGIDDIQVTSSSIQPPSGAGSVSINDVTVSETDGITTATFTVTRSGGTSPFTVDFGTADGSATVLDNDYAAQSGTLSFADGELSKTITVTINGDTKPEGDESFQIVLSNATGGAAISDGVGQGVIANDEITRIYDIQGSGHASALAGQVVTTQGVVTAVDTNGSRGFYIQDVTGDGNAATSDGVFVFLPSGALPTVGHLVNVTGRVIEFTPSGADPGALSTTEIGNATVTDLGVGPAITAVQIGGVGGLLPPTEDLAQGALFYESMEGMLVKVAAPRATGPTNSFGEIFTVVDNDADPTNGYHGTGLSPRGNIAVSGGAEAFGDTNTAGGDFNPERIQIDDDSGVFATTSPVVNTGAVLNDVTGILRYDFGNYEVIATQAITVAQASPLVKEATSLVGDADHLTLASYNAENLDPGDGAARFDTIAAEIVNRLKSSDIISMQEIQDGDGAINSALTSAGLTLQTLVDKVNAQLAGTGAHYAFLDNPFIGDDTNGGEPGGNIRTAFLYRDDRVSFVAGSLRTIDASGAAAYDTLNQQTNPDDPFFGSRPPLVADFVFNGEVVTVVDVHFTSKGGSAVLMGSDQPPFNAGEVQRAAQAQAVNNFVDSLLAANPQAKIVLAGDFNEYAFEEPMSVLRGVASISNYDTPGVDPINATATYTPGGSAVLADLDTLLPAGEHFDYVFEGNSQSLDHVFATQSLMAGAQFDVVRINADFADQTSDHDPLVARFAIAAQAAPSFTSPAAFSTPENSLAVGQVKATDANGDAFAFAIAGGADAGRFAIDPQTGLLTFVAAPDFETREDAGADGVYDLLVSATDTTGRAASQAITVTVTDLAELGVVKNGGNGNDTLLGGTGDDTLSGGNGVDRLEGGDGKDNLIGGNGADLILAGRGDDLLDGGNDDDVLWGGLGRDTLSGGNNADKLYGEGGDDSLNGGNGADLLSGGGGIDILTGGNNQDTFVLGADTGRTTITDFQSDDLIQFTGGVFSSFAQVKAASLQSGADVVIQYGASTVVLEHLKLASLTASDFLFS